MAAKRQYVRDGIGQFSATASAVSKRKKADTKKKKAKAKASKKKPATNRVALKKPQKYRTVTSFGPGGKKTVKRVKSPGYKKALAAYNRKVKALKKQGYK